MSDDRQRVVVFAVFDGVRVLDLTGPLDAFAFTNDLPAPRAPGTSLTALRIVSERGGPLHTSSGLVIATEPLSALDDTEIDTLIVAGGASALRRESTPAKVRAWLDTEAGLVTWIARRAPGIRRLCSVCTGTFLLAAAGQLAGRAVSTHWAAATLLADCFPDLRVEPDRIFVHDGSVWSSGGVTSGIDLALALVEDDFGSEVALKTARVMVVFVKRPGGQSQYSVPLAAQVSDRGTFAALHSWMREHVADDLGIDELAEKAGMSRRTFMRSYAAACGRTPGKTLEAMRLEAARVALEETTKSLKQIARETGFGDEERMRRVFQRQVGNKPGRLSRPLLAAPVDRPGRGRRHAPALNAAVCGRLRRHRIAGGGSGRCCQPWPDAAKCVKRFTYLAFSGATWHSLPGKWHRGRVEI